MTDEEKIYHISMAFKDIIDVLGLDSESEALRDTPERVARMYVNELFSGLNEDNYPKLAFFTHEGENANERITVKEIPIQSICEHHFLPFIGEATVCYIPAGKILGLSKINRLVDYCARRPQTQEGLCKSIARELELALGTPDVAVYIKAQHMCVTMRGVNNTGTYTETKRVGGVLSAQNNMLVENLEIK